MDDFFEPGIDTLPQPEEAEPQPEITMEDFGITDEAI